MRFLIGLRSIVVLSAALAATACGARQRAQLPSPPPPVTPPVEATAPTAAAIEPGDPVHALLAASEAHFAAGERELKLGHLDRARTEFDRALDMLLESPGGGRGEPRIRDQYDRLVDRISAYEVTAIAAGDGFTETAYEPASIDELLTTSTFAVPAPAPELAQTVRDDLASTAHDIPIPLNERVLGYVELFQGRLRTWIETGLTRGSSYLPMIQSVFRAEGLPLDLAYVPLIESSFKPNALSRAKAKGVWQFMRHTARENGLKQDWYVDERSDPEKATRAAANYLKSLHQMFDGDWHLALASYNGGPGRVQRAIRRAGSSDFWELTGSTRFLPRETREYVPMILAAIIIARNPLQYGFNIDAQPPIEYEKVEMPRAVDLRRVAEWTGSSIDEIQALNPELRRWTTPVRRSDYEIKVPVGTASLLKERLAAAPGSELSALKWHTVRRGETIASIARRFRVARADLAEANSLSVRSRLRAGQELLIPRAPASLLASRIERPAPEPVVAASRELGGATTAAEPSGGTDPARVVYRVKRGDTLFSIARVFETTVDALRRWNGLKGSRITPGDRLTVYSSRHH